MVELILIVHFSIPLRNFADGEEEEGDGGDGWNNRRSKGGDLWDDATGNDGGSPSRRAGGSSSGTLDLEDFAAAALKFRSDTRGLGLADMGLDDGGPRLGTQEDALERLLREQNVAERVLKDPKESGGQDVDVDPDNEDEPEWADADVNENIDNSRQQSNNQSTNGRGALPAPTSNSESKRNLLFEVDLFYAHILKMILYISLYRNNIVLNSHSFLSCMNTLDFKY